MRILVSERCDSENTIRCGHIAVGMATDRGAGRTPIPDVPGAIEALSKSATARRPAPVLGAAGTESWRCRPVRLPRVGAPAGAIRDHLELEHSCDRVMVVGAP